jgi:hypothetical protein
MQPSFPQPAHTKRTKLLVAAAVVTAGIGGLVWWQQGGFGGPVSDEAARRYFDRIVVATEAKDFDALCRLNGSTGTCREELRVYCPEDSGSGPAPRFPKGEELLQECRESVPPDPPTVVSSRHHPRKDGNVGGRILLVRGVDGRGSPYETEVLIFRDKRSYKAIHAVFWSGDKFDEVRTPDGAYVTTPGVAFSGVGTGRVGSAVSNRDA